MLRKCIVILISLIPFQVFGNIAPDTAAWTIIYYAAGSNFSESDLMSDIAERMKGKKSADNEIITVVFCSMEKFPVNTKSKR